MHIMPNDFYKIDIPLTYHTHCQLKTSSLHESVGLIYSYFFHHKIQQGIKQKSKKNLFLGFNAFWNKDKEFVVNYEVCFSESYHR